MKTRPIHIALAILSLGALGVLAYRTALPAPSAAQTESVRKPMAGSERATRSATDREVARWQAKTSAEPRVAQHWVNLADALMQKSRETLDPGYYALAEAAAKEGLERDPGSSDAMTSLAWIAGSRHEFASSIRWATKALRVSPRNHLALGLIGDAEVEMGDLEKAAQTYQKMLDLKPDASALSRVAHLEFLRGNADRACRLMAKAVEAGSPFAENTAWCRAQLAGMLNQVGYREDAEAILLDALRRAPGNYHVLAGLGMVYRSKGDRTRAIANFEAAEKIAPRHETLAALEALYRDSGDVARRKVKANQIEANHRLLRDAGVKGDSQMALYLAERGERLPEALRLAEAEYRVLKGISSAHAAAWCRFKTGDHSGAVQAIRAALRHGTPDPKLFAHAAEIFRSAGDSRQATLYWTRAERMDPSVLVRVRLAHSPDKADASL